MNWEELTSPEFAAAVGQCGRVCVLPLGAIEKHGDHLPVGNDSLHAQYVARLAAREEPMMIFPFYPFGHDTHAKCEPGAIAIRFNLLHRLLEAACDEIGRNGFDKILLYSGHGGNNFMLNYFCYKMLDKEKPYNIYFYYMGEKRRGAGCRVAACDGHGGEAETSIMMAAYPELVKGQPAGYGMPLHREKRYRDLKAITPTAWYANHPDMLCADLTPGSVEKGEELIRLETDGLLEVVRLIKSDDEPIKLYQEFHARSKRSTSE